MTTGQGHEPVELSAADEQVLRELTEQRTRGYDAGKKTNGRKRHIAADTLGLLLSVLITAAAIQDRDAARLLLWNLKRAFPSVTLAWADGGYAGQLVTGARTRIRLTVQIVKRMQQHTFIVVPQRWVIEQTLCLTKADVKHQREARRSDGSGLQKMTLTIALCAVPR